MGTALGKGENAALEAARQAISWPMLEGASIQGARDIFVNVTASSRLGLHELNEACALIRQAADNEDVQLNFGILLNEAMGEAVKLTVIATGFPRQETRTANGQEPLVQPAWPPQEGPEIAAAWPAPPEAQPVPPPPEEPVDPDDWEQPAYRRQGKVLH
jgi:cell division protein FtsZ